MPSRPVSKQSPLWFLGQEVQRARRSAGLTVKALSDMVPCSVATVSRIENGLQAPTQEFAAAMDRIFPDKDGLFGRFWEEQSNWAGGYRPHFAPWIEIERESDSLRWWSPLLVPGLLQTEDYARAIITAGLPGHEPETDVAKRVERQQILTREAPADLLALLGEPVLTCEVGSARVMAAQMGHLLKMGALPNITIQIVLDGLAGAAGGFAVASSGNADIAAYLESSLRPSTLRGPDLVALAARLYDHMRAEALPARESARLITEASERWTRLPPQRGASPPSAAPTRATVLRSAAPEAPSWSGTLRTGRAIPCRWTPPRGGHSSRK